LNQPEETTMSTGAVNGVSPISAQQNGPGGVTSIPPVTSFGQELDAQGAKAHGHHHGGGSHAVTSSAASAASAAGVSLPSTIAASLHRLLG
jgi:hypothetical protein